MELGAALGVLRRRRWFLVVGMVGVVAALGGAAASAHPQYQVTNTVLLTPPVANPYLDVTEALDVLARGTAAQTADQGTATLLGRRGATSIYTVGLADGNSAALVVTAKDRDVATAVRTTLAVDGEIQTVLVDRQRSLAIPARAFIGSRRLDQPVAQRFNKTRNRLLAVIGGAGVVAALLACFAIEGMTVRRRANRLRSPPQRRADRFRVLRRGAAGGAALLVLGAASAYELRRPPPWEASTSIELIPPQFPPDLALPVARQGVLNPFQSFDASYNIVSELVANRATSKPARAALARRGLGGEYDVINYTIGANPVDTTGNPTPLLEVTSTSADPASAERTVAAVAAVLSQQVAVLQAASGAPRATWMRTVEVSPPAAAQLHTSRTRGLAVLGVLALVGAIAAGRVFDALCVQLSARVRARLTRRRMPGETGGRPARRPARRPLGRPAHRPRLEPSP